MACARRERERSTLLDYKDDAMRVRFSLEHVLRWAVPCTLVAMANGCVGAGVAPTPGANPAALQSFARTNYVAQQIASGAFFQACPNVAAGQFRCLALGLRDFARAPRTEMPDRTSVAGYGPAQLQAAYDITSEAKTNPGGTVVIVDAFGYPTLAKDLARYRKYFKLRKCDISSGCLSILNQDGKASPLPSPPTGSNVGWIGEQAIDVSMVSANCPNCHIVMIEATTNYGNDLFAAERTAANLHPSAISNSWGGEEYKSEKRDEKKFFDHSGIAITASSGDDTYAAGVIVPSVFNTVTAVGGTTLNTAHTKRGYAEVVWPGTESGCSAYIPVPTWQRPIEKKLGGCSKRIVADIAYDADPDTGVAVYESYGYDGVPPGWQVWGGTSVGAPAIAAIYALSGNTSGVPASLAYSNSKDLYDVTSGSDGSCKPAYLCTGKAGYDGPTGNGTPNGTKAF
jgi:subtilase family serine protease